MSSEARSKPTILVVDDDRGLSRLIEKVLQREGFSTASAASFDEAIDWLQKHQPELMLLDLKLQEIGGKELIDHLSVNGPSVPFIIITGQGDERVAVSMMKRGAIDYLVKDVDFLEFVPEVVRRALGQLERDRKLAAAEEALRRSKANLAKAQQIAHLGSFELNVPPSHKDYRSEEIFRILGLDPAAIQNGEDPYLERFVHSGDRMKYRATLDRAITEAAPFSFEYRVVRPDGSVRFVESVGEPIRNRSGTVVKLVGTLLDVTVRKHAELRLAVQYATANALAESSTLTEASPRILRAIAETLDWDLGELWQVDRRGSSLRWVDTYHGDAAPDSPSALRNAHMTLSGATGLVGQAWKRCKPVWSSDSALQNDSAGGKTAGTPAFRCGVAFPILLGAEVLGALVFFSQQSRPADEDLLEMFAVLGSQIGQFVERKRAQEALRKEHAFTAAVLETSSALVVVLDRRGHIVGFNRACEQTTGYSASEVKGKLCWDLFVVPDELEQVKSVFERLRSGTFPSRYENYWRTRSGDKRLVAWSNSALLDDEGEVEYVISVGIDVTDRRRLEQEILQISDQEQRRIGQDLHDGICQQLAATELMSEILQQRLEKKSRADAARVAEIAKQVREAIIQTRLVARGLSPVVVESEGLMSALQELADYTERMFRVGCQFKCELPVLVDDHATATHLYRIAQEAVSNAIRHGRASRIIISLDLLGSRMTLRIKDNGSGLDKDLPRSRGMGLRIMQYRATMIGGTISVQNDAGGGASVVCTIQKPHHAHAPAST